MICHKHFQLWDDYQYGIGGKNAARLLTHQECDRVKHKYHWNKVVWGCIGELVHGGVTAQVAIDHIYRVYGENQTKTMIMNRMKSDQKAGRIHELLQV